MMSRTVPDEATCRGIGASSPEPQRGAREKARDRRNACHESAPHKPQRGGRETAQGKRSATLGTSRKTGTPPEGRPGARFTPARSAGDHSPGPLSGDIRRPVQTRGYAPLTPGYLPAAFSRLSEKSLPRRTHCMAAPKFQPGLCQDSAPHKPQRGGRETAQGKRSATLGTSRKTGTPPEGRPGARFTPARSAGDHPPGPPSGDVSRRIFHPGLRSAHPGLSPGRLFKAFGKISSAPDALHGGSGEGSRDERAR